MAFVLVYEGGSFLATDNNAICFSETLHHQGIFLSNCKLLDLLILIRFCLFHLELNAPHRLADFL